MYDTLGFPRFSQCPGGCRLISLSAPINRTPLDSIDRSIKVFRGRRYISGTAALYRPRNQIELPINKATRRDSGAGRGEKERKHTGKC
jgi:hypothetical protein